MTPPHLRISAAVAALVALFALVGIQGGAGAGAGLAECPVLGEPTLLGPLAQKENRAPFSTRQVSGRMPPFRPKSGEPVVSERAVD